MAEAKYTWGDIIIDPTSDRAKEAVGKQVYYSQFPNVCLLRANNDDRVLQGILISIDPKNSLGSFIVDGSPYACIIVKKEEPYAERAKKWIKENGLKKGDYVKVVRKAKDYEDGWDGRWTKERDDFIGKVIPVSDIGESTGVILSYCCCDWAGYDFPYFVLEKVEPEPKYVPFESPQEFISAYNKASKEVMSDTESMLSKLGIWLKGGEHYELVTYIHRKGITIDDVSINWKTLFDFYTFLDGSPVGKEVNGEATLHEKKMQDDLPIGTRFLDGGQLVEVVDGHQCGDCVFAEIDCSQKRCVSEERSDKKNVYFKEVKS